MEPGKCCWGDVAAHLGSHQAGGRLPEAVQGTVGHVPITTFVAGAVGCPPGWGQGESLAGSFRDLAFPLLGRALSILGDAGGAVVQGREKNRVAVVVLLFLFPPFPPPLSMEISSIKLFTAPCTNPP